MIEKFEQWLKENSITEVECLVPDLGGIATTQQLGDELVSILSRL